MTHDADGLTGTAHVRRVAWGTVAVLGAAFVAVAALAVPWDAIPGDAIRPLDPADHFTAAEIARGDAFARWARVWGYSSLAVSLAVTMLFGFSRWGERLVMRMPGPWWTVVPLTVAALMLIGRVTTLPFAVALRLHVRDYGLSRQPWSGFARDLVVSQLVVIATTSVVVLVLVGCARRWRRAWPAVAGTMLGGLVVLGSLAYPVVIEPLFNSFEPLPPGELRTEILALADRQGVEVGEVLVADASRRTTTLNAYVSGFAGTRRVVVYDNVVDDLGQAETLSVVAHELAHARHHDVVLGTGLGALGVGAGVGLLALILGSRRDLRDPRTVPRVLALVALATLLATPVQNGISRAIEWRADAAALGATGDPGAFVSLQRDLARRSASDLTPLRVTQWWFGSHPTTMERIALAQWGLRGSGSLPRHGLP